MRPIPEGRHPGQPSRRPCVGRARGAATTGAWRWRGRQL